MPEMLRRYIDARGLIAQSDTGEETYKIRGTPIVYNQETILYDDGAFRVTEIIEPGAARAALAKKEQVMLWNHDPAKPMAARRNGTLKVSEGIDGVHIEADASGSAWGRDGVEAIRAGLVNKMSFGFTVSDGGETCERMVEGGKKIVRRIIKAIDSIFDFSPVTFPAYEGTSISARDMEEVKKEISDFEAEELKRSIGEFLDEFPEQETSA